LREHNSKVPVTMISREPNLPIDRTKLSKGLVPDADKILLRPQQWFDDACVATVTDDVTAVDFEEKTVTTKSGKSIPYSKLVLATGGTPRRLPLPGFKELENIFVLRATPDVKDILGALGEKGKKIVVVGSSFIGMEVANALAKENTVTIIGMEKYPLERVMGAEVGAIFKKMVEKSGVKFYMEAGVEKATPKASNPKAVGAVHLKDGTELEADLVILGVGVAPATEFLKGNKAVELQKDGSLKTNEQFEVQGLKDVFAIGDIATYPYYGPGGDGAMIRVEHWNVAQNAGRNVGQFIADPSSKPKNFTPVFWSAMGSQLRYCGNTLNGYDDFVLTGKPDEAKFVAYYTKGETVVAVASIGMDPAMTASAELMRVGKMPTKSELKNGANPVEAF
jgi:NADPH-dependent 2,4-dienoyl-CoA reductase/sulfur reductase-like enzyme